MANEPWKFQNRRFVSDNPAKTFGDKSTQDATDVLAGKKKTWTEVDYRPASMDSTKRCHECKFYKHPGMPESDCERVIDIVKAEGTCDLFSQRDYFADKPAGDSGKKTEIVIRLG